MDLKELKAELVGAGLEVYRTRPTEIQIAERVRLHIMDSGIRVRVSEQLEVVFVARSQRSDYPDEVSVDELFERVRRAVGRSALERGYAETEATTTEVHDPIDASRVLDVWHEVTYAKATSGSTDAIDEVRWALGIERFVPPEG